MSLKEKTLSGVKWTTFSTVINASIQLLQIGILARFLDVSDFGLLAIITLVIGFSNMFVDFGISSAIIHNQNITNNQLSTLYWLNVFFSLVIFTIIFFSAPFIADFYDDTRLTELIIYTSLTIIIQAFGKQFFVLFEKKLMFNLLSKIEMFGVFIGFLFSVYLAVSGYGIYALILPLILTMFIKSVLLVYFGLQYHKPKIYFNIYEVKEFLVFGIYQLGSGIVNYFNSQIDIIIIGKIFGSETLGLYSIIKQLVMKPSQIINPIITRVSFPVMSQIQHDDYKLKEVYLKTINYLSSVNFPIYITMIILASELITIFLGEKWLKGIEIFQILSLYGLLRSTGNPVGSLTLAKGKPEYGFYWTLGLLFITPPFIYIGSIYGITGVSWSMVSLMILLMIPNWYFLVNKLCSAGFVEYHLSIIKPLIISSINGIVCFLLFMLLKTNIIILDITIVSFIGFIGIILLNMIFNKEFINTLKSLVKING